MFSWRSERTRVLLVDLEPELELPLEAQSVCGSQVTEALLCVCASVSEAN